MEIAEKLPENNMSWEDIDKLLQKASLASKAYLELNQEQVDKIVKEVTLEVLEKHQYLAKLAIEETKMGVYEDKITKNMFASETVYHSIKYKKTVGIIEDNEEEDYLEVAEPLGVVVGLVPLTNPTSTVIFKALICLKTRNPIIFSFHPKAYQCGVATAKIMRDEAIKNGAPFDCISWIENPNLQRIDYLMKHKDVSFIIATGGAGMVKSAYSAGKPALGVGPGNVPCYIDKSANITRAVADLMLSKTFDNGMICASEQAVIIHQDVYVKVIQEMKEQGCYFVSEKEKEQLEKILFKEENGKISLKVDIVGQSAVSLAKKAGFIIDAQNRVLVANLTGVGKDYPLSMEKLSPILSCYKAKDFLEGMDLAYKIVSFGGMGHSAVIHAEDKEIQRKFSLKMPVGRVIVNSPATQGAIGDLYNVNIPSFTLGCGSMGRNSTTSNVSVDQLFNIKKVARRRPKLQWFRVPERIYFSKGSVAYLSKYPQMKKIFLVSDFKMGELGMVERALYHLQKRENPTLVEIFNEVEPEPSLETVEKGVKKMQEVNPDTIIALGGGSVMDAAKAMWLFYEYPELDFEALALKFMDIRKRTYKYPKLGRKIKFIAIPTTSGTGSEVTAFSVITDKKRHIKCPLADYELTPDVAIIDPDFVLTMPPNVVADTGMDALSHAIEAYVSVMASEYTDALALKACELIFTYLPSSYHNPQDEEAKEKMHHASCLAGMAFTNAFLGINHSLAHAIGGTFGISHGRANAIFLPYVIAYNAKTPAKSTAYPQYEYYKAPEKYRELSSYLGFKDKTISLIREIQKLLKSLDIPLDFSGMGIDSKSFKDHILKMAEQAFNDQVTLTNPRSPLVSELEDLFALAYGGNLAKEVEINKSLLDFSWLKN